MSYRFGPDAAALADHLTHNGCEGRPDRATNVRRVAYDPAQPGACARLVADTIREALQKGRPKPSNRDFAVVLRDVDQSIEIETALMEAKIPYKCDGFETFLLLPEILLLRGVLHYACGDYTALKGHAETCVQMVLALSRYFYLTRDPRHWNLEGAGRVRCWAMRRTRCGARRKCCRASSTAPCCARRSSTARRHASRRT